MESNKNLVVVLSRNYATGLSVIRSLGSAGYTVDLVASAFRKGKSEIARCSKYVRNSVEIVSRKVKDGNDVEFLDELLKYGDMELGYKPVLFPTDDYTASVMDLNRNALSEIFIMPEIIGGGEGSMTVHMSKIVQSELAKRAGIPTPLEWTIPLDNPEIEIPSDMVYPCFVKPVESITGYKKEMARCNSEEELYRHLNRLRRKFANRSVLVQEFLEIDNEIDFSGICFDDKIIIPAIIKKTNVAQYEKGVTLSGKLVPFEEIGDLQDKIIKMMQSFHYFGMFDFELAISGDKVYFNEVNLRSGGPNYSYFKSGVNLPELFVKEAYGEPHTPEEEKIDEYNKTFIYEKIAWEDHIKGFMSKKELKECIDNSDITLLRDEQDPLPYEYFSKEIKRAKRRRFKNKIKKTVKRTIKSIYKVLTYRLKKVLRPVKYHLLSYPQTKKKNRRDPNSPLPRVLVSGRNYCSNLTMARSLGKAGYEVEVLRIFQVRPKQSNLLKKMQPDTYSEYIKGYYVCVSRRKNRRIVKRLIKLADPNRKMLLIPADDLVAYVADHYYDKLSKYYLIPNINNEQDGICNLMSKEAQKNLAIEANLPVLNSCVIQAYKGEFEIPETVTYPCFMKPNISKNSSKGRMRKCENEEELRGYLTKFSKRKPIEMLVEDFVEINKEYSLLGVSTKNGVIGPGFFVAEQGGQKEHRGVAVVGRTLPCSMYQELIDDILKFIETLNFDGLYDVDLIETADGKMYFVELNLRFGASGYAFTECGVNLPGMFADYMIKGIPLDLDVKVEETGKTFVSEKVLIEEYVGGRLSREKYKEYMETADIHFIKDDNDKKAFRHFKMFYPIAVIMRKAIQIKQRKEAEQENKLD